MDLYNPHLIKKLEEDIKKNPKSKSFSILANIYYRKSEIQKAKELCMEGLKHHPFYSPALILLSEIHFKEEQYDLAIKLLNQAKELNPENPRIYKNLAQIYKKQKNAEKALSAYKMLAFLSPNDSTAISSAQHLEKILRPPLVSVDDNKLSAKKEQAESVLSEKEKLETYQQEKLTKHQKEKLIKLNQILARVETYMEQTGQV